MSNVFIVDSYDKDIAASGTPENLIADPDLPRVQWKYAKEVIIKTPTGNSGIVYLGSEDRQNFPLPANTEIRLSSIINRMSQSGKFDLANIYVRVASNGDDINVLLIDPTND